ncbi:Glutathione synthase/RimK-type ligase, ATP-grasp superfamily [Thermomonospora echinospora]|uniref:Glutathione synthase/RimK-type ligase, ATP-grasp superfamily n=1 Tax=Thermomonospora echinospora TaxID=1992 RepID=A0A1H6CVZ6_9ACTN|nr:ATP-dependent carboxylate-amine ligase [Thermomonospora echinospora]SEG76977.1 Glutathione synthase/RimK-type ligase, ATP-grasp superfamily [Thermomonospora echinospora]
MTSAQPTVLILTQEFDPTVDPVVRSLGEKGATVVRVDLSYFPQHLSFTTANFGGGRRVLRHQDRTVDLQEVSGVWYRRPTAFVFDETMGEAERQFAHKEARHGIGGILRGTDCLWVNRPDLDAVAELKPYQLTLAEKAGLHVPRTLLTNDPQEAAAMVRDSPRPVVYKALSGGVVPYPGGFPSGLLTTVVGDEFAEHAERVRHTICMFQEYVEKAYEIRLTVIGNTYFPVVIRSQDNDATKVDWRGADHQPYGDYEPLPEEVVKGVQALLGELGLVYGAVDFIVTPEGEYVFLEVNPGGQFIWMQHELGLPLSDCIADLLMAGGPFHRDEVTQVGY